MLVPVFFVFLLCQTSAEPVTAKYRCDDTSSNAASSNATQSMTFTKSSDGVEGRFTAELCTKKKDKEIWTDWNLDLMYNNNMPACNTSTKKLLISPLHSSSTLKINDIDITNCTHDRINFVNRNHLLSDKHGPMMTCLRYGLPKFLSGKEIVVRVSNHKMVCYAMDFDMIFSSCYLLKSTLERDSNIVRLSDTYHLVSNNLTEEYFMNRKPYVNLVNHEDGESLQWHLKIPPVEYKVSLEKYNNDTKELEFYEDVTNNCTVESEKEALLNCLLAPAPGYYQVIIRHGGPWTTGCFLGHKYATYVFRRWPLPPPQVRARGSARWAYGALGAAALLLAAALFHWLAPHWLCKDLAARLRKLYSDPALPVPGEPDAEATLQPDAVVPLEAEARAADGVRAEGAGDSAGPAILLLYARECELGMEFVEMFKEILESTTKTAVVDLHSAEAAALSAAAASLWLRALLARRGVRVLLLQAPAAAAYRPQLLPHRRGFRLSEPLLGRADGALYRRPRCSDQLLHEALRLVAQTATLYSDYRKLYIATFSDSALETDVMEAVQSYRRYRLPESCASLLQDLGAAPAPPQLLQALQLRAQHFATFVREQPDYLNDLLFQC